MNFFTLIQIEFQKIKRSKILLLLGAGVYLLKSTISEIGRVTDIGDAYF